MSAEKSPCVFLRTLSSPLKVDLGDGESGAVHVEEWSGGVYGCSCELVKSDSGDALDMWSLAFEFLALYSGDENIAFNSEREATDAVHLLGRIINNGIIPYDDPDVLLDGRELLDLKELVQTEEWKNIPRAVAVLPGMVLQINPCL